MACLEMYNSSPRISFSYDFVDPHQFTNRPSSSPPPPASSDFEFSVSNHNLVCADMICADELFSKGKLLPFKYSGNNKSRAAAAAAGGGGGATTTLRDELLTGHHDDEIPTSSSSPTSFPKPPKSSGNRWKGFLGLRRSHIGSKKPEKTDGCDSAGLSADQPKSHGHPRPDFDSDPLYNMTSQEKVNNGGSSSRGGVEMGI